MLASEIAAIQRQRLALTASAVQDEALVTPLVPDFPPASWFDTPETPGPMPLTVQPDGQVYGHLALWGTCHTGHPNRCVQPPSSPSSYRFFHTGAVDTAEGTTVATGRITAETGHPSLTASRASAVRHYDETGFAAADVRARDGQFGIWVAGALRPDATPHQVRALKASVLSGDWRSVNGSLEMIGALAVNVGGFLVPRAEVALAASGDETGGEMVMALVSAGVCYPPDETEPDEMDDRRKRARMKALVARGLGTRALINAGLGLTASSILMQSRTLIASSFDESKHPRNKATGKDGKESPMDGGKFTANPDKADMRKGPIPIKDMSTPVLQRSIVAHEAKKPKNPQLDPKGAQEWRARQKELGEELQRRLDQPAQPETLSRPMRVEKRYSEAEGGHPKGFGLGPNYRIKTSPGDAPKHSVKERTRDRFGRRRVPGIHGS